LFPFFKEGCEGVNKVDITVDGENNDEKVLRMLLSLWNICVFEVKLSVATDNLEGL